MNEPDALIDLDHLRSLRRDMGCAEVAELVDLFDEEMGPLVTGLRAADARLADDLHSLRGAAASLGMVAVAARTLADEAQALTGGTPDPDDLRRLVGRSTAAIRAALARPVDQIRNSASVSSSVMSR